MVVAFAKSMHARNAQLSGASSRLKSDLVSPSEPCTVCWDGTCLSLAATHRLGLC
jgi:hypothetical protein